MSVLALLIPPRPRPPAPPVPPADDPASLEYDYVFSHDGLTVHTSGRSIPALLPRADRVVALLADADVAWHRITVPKAPASKLRAALGGVMEDVLLEDEDDVHLALAPGATAGQPAWVAAVHKPWLAGVLGALDTVGLEVERVAPSQVPGEAASGHFFVDESRGHRLMLALADEERALTLAAAGSLARSLLPPAGTPVQWSATPAAAAPAERWLGAAVAVLPETERALRSLRAPWNLRQFDLAMRHRGTRALRETLRRLLSPEWRAARYAALALVALQLVGLNAWAWQQQRQIAGRRAAMGELLRAAHPGVRAVYDAPVQMQRENDRLRAAAGRPGDTDLEVLLGAAAAAWPDGQGPVQNLRFEGGRLTLSATGWGPAQLSQFRDRLRPAGLQAELAEGRVTISRGSAPAPQSAALARPENLS